ncbi:MAG: threonine synthase [Deltaproteobacteria bacterium]|nr:threonine synthase [Deltaproteobacteria bacterium]
MHYVSTRGESPALPFQETIMAGLARDGGLFLPETLPEVKSRFPHLQNMPFQELFQELVRPFLSGSLKEGTLTELVQRSYSTFAHPEITPVREVGGIHVCELFHGPTLAFKDVALQFLGNLFEHFLEQTGGKMTVLGATSGDTGSAAIHALRGRKRVQVFILFPHQRVSPMQERQMTTVSDANVHALAVRGSFDDAQAIVKELFNDRAFNEEMSLGAINSINWARVMAQITYFFYAYFRVVGTGALRLGDPVRVAVPTGNFGHMYAGLLARRMGLPLDKLILATNANDILDRFVHSGRYEMNAVRQTHSPSMDIQVASNFERYLYDLCGRNSAQVRSWLTELNRKGGFSVTEEQRDQVHQDFEAVSVSDEETLATIARVHREAGYLLDPHSAIAYRAAGELSGGLPVISMATAHPAKFSAAIAKALGHAPELPPALAALEALPTRVQLLDAQAIAVRDHMRRSLT